MKKSIPKFIQNAALPSGMDTNILMDCFYREMTETEKTSLSAEEKLHPNKKICLVCEGNLVLKLI